MKKRIIYWTFLGIFTILFLVISIMCLYDYFKGVTTNSGWSIISLFLYSVFLYMPLCLAFLIIEIVMIVNKKSHFVDYVLLSLIWIIAIVSLVLTFVAA